MPDPLAMFEAGFKGIRLNADGTPNYTFECGESGIDSMEALTRAKTDHRYLMVIVYAMDDWEGMERDARV